METQYFKPLCEMLRDLKGQFTDLPPEPPWGTGRPDPAIVQKYVQGGAERIPPPYRREFVKPLLEKFEKRILPSYRTDPPRLEAFTGAVYQHDRNFPNAEGYRYARPLRRLLAVVSDFYQSFLHKAQEKGDFQILERLPPLAAFSYTGKTPFTIPVDDVHKTIGGSVAVVSMPVFFASNPILWAVDAHETGGHDVVHAIPNLLNELTAGLSAQLDGISIPGLWPGELAGLWSFWMDEAVADVYAVLNVGPMFGAGVAAYVAALREKLNNLPPGRVDLTSTYPDPHPTDILRIHLVLGAAASLSRLSEAKRQSYVADLEKLADICAGFGFGDAVTITGYRLWRDHPVTAVMPLAPMQESARRVGRYIARARLRALGGRCIQEIETWDDDDEKAATEIRDALKRGAPIDTGPDGDPGRTARVFAGALMCLLEAPPKDYYENIGCALSAVFERRFVENALWQTVKFNPMEV